MIVGVVVLEEVVGVALETEGVAVETEGVVEEVEGLIGVGEVNSKPEVFCNFKQIFIS